MRDDSSPTATVPLGLSCLFFASGFSALLYQNVWQRTLFSIYGINIESVTMIVSAFMLGLGLGSLAGGSISKDPTRAVLLWFAGAEGFIGFFGFFSLQIFHRVGELTLDLSPLLTGLVTFALVLVPTLLMGATLPLLVAHMVRVSSNVGESVGGLYFANTLGSAVSSYVAVQWLFRKGGQSGTVRLAAAINFAVAVVAVAHHRLSKSAAREPRP
jgi:spermidine synthase